MAKELTQQQVEDRRRARQMARAAGKDWKKLPTEERRAFIKQASRPRAGKPGANPMLDKARAAAARAGKVWRDLPDEERRKFLAQARLKP
jgi:acyl-CoA reductase-like NAD-dependent aldehyde dehydrogenase